MRKQRIPKARGLSRAMSTIGVVVLAGVVLLAVRNIKPFNVRYAAAAFPWVMLLLAANRICRR